MSRNIFFSWDEYHKTQELLEKREKLLTAFEEWNGTPRLADGLTLPWAPYARHDYYELYTHFLYYPFRTFKEFAFCYGLNYKSSQTWSNQRLFPGVFGINGDWKGSKLRWLWTVVEDNDIEVMEMLRNPDDYVIKYSPLSLGNDMKPA